MKEVMCLHQLHRPKIQLYNELRPDGCGNCAVCTPDVNNEHCSHYCPVTITFIEVKEKNK